MDSMTVLSCRRDIEMSDQAPREHSNGPAPSTDGLGHALEAQIRHAGDRALARVAEELRMASVPRDSLEVEAQGGEIRLNADDVARLRALIQPASRKAPPSGSAEQDLLDSLGY